MLASDYTEICLKEPYSREQVEAFAARHLSFAKRTPVFLGDGRCIVAFRTPSDAGKAHDIILSRLEELDLEERQVVKKRKREENGSKRHNLTICLDLRRRKRTNFCFVKYHSVDSINIAAFQISIASRSSWRAKMSKKSPGELFVTNMDPGEREEDARKKIYLAMGTRNVEVKLPSEKNFVSSAQEIARLEDELKRDLPTYLGVPAEFYEVRLPSNCQPHHVVWKVFIAFQNIDVGVRAASHLEAVKDSVTFSDGVRSYPYEKSEFKVDTTVVTYVDVFKVIRDCCYFGLI